MTHDPHPLAVITGTSRDIGPELARLCAGMGYDLLLVADDSATHEVADSLDEPTRVASIGFEVMLEGEGSIVAGWRTKAHVPPADVLDVMHRKLSEPSSGTDTPSSSA